MSETITLPSWDLSDLYAATDDPRLDTDLKASLAEAIRFEEAFKGKIATADAATLKQALDEYEALSRAQSRPGSYASLHYSTDTTDPARGALVQKVRELGSEIATHLLFFDLEIGKMAEENYQKLIADPLLAPYRHYLEHEREVSRHHLSEVEETILEETANSRGRAFRRLFTEVTSRMKFPFQDKMMTQSELLAFLYDPDREKRKGAFESLSGVLQQNNHVLTFITNTLLHEKQTMDRLRGFATPESDRHLANELPAEVVNTMVEVVVKNFSIVADYYRLKKRLLGLDELAHYDRYAPLAKDRAEIAYDEARQIVLDAFRRFSGQMADMTEPFFTKNWIDAPPKDGKRGGAFCAAVTPDHHPYVLLNYTGKARDVMTLAHELGHGIHDLFAAKNHILDYYPVLPLAETASTFAELLVFEKLQENLTSDSDRLALLCEKLEDTFATVFRQVSMYRFEQRVHAARRAEGELTAERINELWQGCMQEMFQDALTLGDDHKWTWSYIPHIVQTPFYVYAYAFGELLVLSLYARYRQEGEPFVAKYFKLLEAGGSKRPVELLAELDIDIRKAEFWQGGCDLIRRNLEKAQSLAGS